MINLPDGLAQKGLVVGLVPQADTVFAIVLAANVSQQIAIPFAIAGSNTSGVFQAAETVTQAGSGATGICMVVPTGSILLLGGSTGTPNATGLWTGGTSGAIWKPTLYPVFSNRVLFSVSGGIDFYMKFVNAAIAVPGANATDGTAPELNPLLRMCSNKGFASLVSGSNCVVTMAFYS